MFAHAPLMQCWNTTWNTFLEMMSWHDFDAHPLDRNRVGFFALWMSCWKWFFLGCSCRPCVVVEFMRSSGTVVVCLSEPLMRRMSSASHRTRTQHIAHNMTHNGHMTIVPTNQSTHRSNHNGRTVAETGHEDQRGHHTLTHNMSCS